MYRELHMEPVILGDMKDESLLMNMTLAETQQQLVAI